jgi:hypothetical protein
MKFLNFLKSLLFTEVKPIEETKIRRAIIDIEPVAEAPVVKPKKKRVYKKKK